MFTCIGRDEGPGGTQRNGDSTRHERAFFRHEERDLARVWP